MHPFNWRAIEHRLALPRSAVVISLSKPKSEVDWVKTVNVHQAKTTVSALLAEVEHGKEFVIAHNGTPVAKLVPVAPSHTRQAGALRDVPEWRSFTYDASLFAPMTDAELTEEGWE